MHFMSLDRNNHRFIARDPAFTLVELLVVIAIIALLLALLLPGLQRARYVAKEAACMAGLKQIGVGLTTYASANRTWFPKNGAIRNSPSQISNSANSNEFALLREYFSDMKQAFRCPLLLPDMKTSETTSSYNLLFNTRGTNGVTGSIGGYGSVSRLEQYDVNDQLIADLNQSGEAKYSLSQFSTWYYPRVDPKQLMQKLGNTWTRTSDGAQFDLLASDIFTGRGHPVQSRQSNHPEPSEQWIVGSNTYQGPKLWEPASSGNYLGADGRAEKLKLPGTVYWPATYWYHKRQWRRLYPAQLPKMNDVIMARQTYKKKCV